jgi:hypothetical protein
MNESIERTLVAHDQSHEPTELVAPPDQGGIMGEDEVKAASTKIRRISAELTGDMAVEADLISTMLRLDEKGRSKVERDTLLVELGIQALNAAIERWRKETGRKFPDHEDVRRYLLGT